MRGYLKELKLNDNELGTISGGSGLTNLTKVLSSLQKKGFGNMALNLSIIIIANSYIGGDLIIDTRQH